MDIVGRYTAIILAVILMILFPLQYIAQAQDETIADIVNSKALQFTDTARHQGCITLDMYEGLFNELSCTGELFDIEMEISHPVSGKELAERIPKDIRTVNHIREASVSTCTDSHIDTEPVEIICPICGNPYSLRDDGTDPGCPVCSNEVISIDVLEESVTVLAYNPLNLTVVATYKDGHTGVVTDWSTDFIASAAGTYEVTVFYQSSMDNVIVKVVDNWTTLCPYCGNEYDRSVYPSGCPGCSVTVTGIEATLRYGGTQVRAGQPLALEIILIYRDTHRAFTYSGYTVIGYHANQLGYQSVTVQYGGMSTTLDIEVIDDPLMSTCPNGHGYVLNDDGSDPGCPYCDDEAEKDSAIYYFDITYTSVILNSLYTEGKLVLNKGDYLTITVTQRDATIRSRMKKMFFMTNNGISRRKYTFAGEVS